LSAKTIFEASSRLALRPPTPECQRPSSCQPLGTCARARTARLETRGAGVEFLRRAPEMDNCGGRGAGERSANPCAAGRSLALPHRRLSFHRACRVPAWRFCSAISPRLPVLSRPGTAIAIHMNREARGHDLKR
jgi:hypothetical protein